MAQVRKMDRQNLTAREREKVHQYAIAELPKMFSLLTVSDDKEQLRGELGNHFLISTSVALELCRFLAIPRLTSTPSTDSDKAAVTVPTVLVPVYRFESSLFSLVLVARDSDMSNSDRQTVLVVPMNDAVAYT